MERPPDERSDARDASEHGGEPVPDSERQTDLLAVGLLVFFVSLIGIVGALLLLPVLL